MKTTRLSAFALLAFIGLAFGLAACAVALQAPPTAKPTQQGDWLTYTSADAAYAFDYPAGATIETSDDEWRDPGPATDMALPGGEQVEPLVGRREWPASLETAPVRLRFHHVGEYLDPSVYGIA